MVAYEVEMGFFGNIGLLLIGQDAYPSLSLFGWKRDTGECLDDRRVVFTPVAGSRGGHKHLMGGSREGQREFGRTSGVENEPEVLNKNIRRREWRVITGKN